MEQRRDLAVEVIFMLETTASYQKPRSRGLSKL
jgi:hypothetical protein